MLTDLVVGLLSAHPAFAGFMTVVGFARVMNKPLFAMIQAIVDKTENPADDKWWDEVQKHKAMKSLFWVLDWTASVKIPKSKK